MNNILLITNKIEKVQSGGRELLSKLNHDILKDLHSSQLIVTELVRYPIRGIKSVVNAFRGHIDGINFISIQSIFSLISSHNIEVIFVDGSNLGAVVKLVKLRFPKVRICTFFHNVETKFFLGSLWSNRSVHALAVLIANYLAERKAVRYSNNIVCLSDRDSRLLHRLYGRFATHISPMALEDKFTDSTSHVKHSRNGRYALFVGGGFYANRAGITWFCEQVAPNLDFKTCIVGRGLEDLKGQLEQNGNVEVIGAVDSLSQWYRDAHFVIAPIFDGSGMKTKVAEALMFGKKIVGTAEAFSGYEEIADQAGWLCASSGDFVAAMKDADSTINCSFNRDLRTTYETIYSFEAARARMREIIDATCRNEQ
jgi:glycosyltransferase involved in cell wall biosynthesis